MCCLFGILNYSGLPCKENNNLINKLAREATARGTDSTGIAYYKNNKLTVYKKPKHAALMNFDGIENCIAITGHTRHATQGSYKLNYNNHPFFGKADIPFALSHNGILWNDAQLQKQYNIPQSKITTDSYIAVQLLEHFGALTAANVAKMAEAVEGSYSFTINDANDTLWLIKGDSPLSILHFPKKRAYIYASTDAILMQAITQTDYMQDIYNKAFERVDIKAGDILRITADGKQKRDKFKYETGYSNKYYNCRWWTYGGGWSDYDNDDEDDDTTEAEANTAPADTLNDADDANAAYNNYIEELKAAARWLGTDPDEIDELLGEGYTLDDIEEYIYSAY